MISQELESKIVRLYHVEKWRVGTISKQLGVHHDTVMRVLSQVGQLQAPSIERARKIDPYLPFVLGVLKEYPTEHLYGSVRGALGNGGAYSIARPFLDSRPPCPRLSR